MALTIEDGTIVSGADSWITVVELEAYLSPFGRTLTAADETAKEVLLRKAQRAISTRYTLAGDLVEQEQATALPRYWPDYIKGFSIGSDEIPRDFKDAQAELAWAIDQGSDPFADRSASNAAKGAQTSTRAKAGPVETENEYSDIGHSGKYDALDMANYTAVDALLKPYLVNQGPSVRLYRS